jgi:hypothetical protein
MPFGKISVDSDQIRSVHATLGDSQISHRPLLKRPISVSVGMQGLSRLPETALASVSLLVSEGMFQQNRIDASDCIGMANLLSPSFRSAHGDLPRFRSHFSIAYRCGDNDAHCRAQVTKRIQISGLSLIKRTKSVIRSMAC